MNFLKGKDKKKNTDMAFWIKKNIALKRKTQFGKTRFTQN